MRIGIVGLPNVGKSTLFNALVSAGRSTFAKASADKGGLAEMGNFPFTTIDPNVGVVVVPDPRLQELARISKSAKITPTVIEFVDIAGLVKDAHKGEGLGNKFLSHIREVDAIVHVIRFFEGGNVTHVDNSVDPIRDAETIKTELELADLQTSERMKKKGTDESHTIPKLADKPTLFVANLDEVQIKNADEVIKDFTEKVLAHLPDKATRRSRVLPISIKVEQELTELSPEEQTEFLREFGLTETGLTRLIQASYKLLNLITFLTTGPTETRAWTLQRGTYAPQAAGKIHSDMERGFIRAEVISYTDFVKVAAEGPAYAGARAQGLLRDEGKEYIVKDGDVMLFKFNV